MPRPSTILRVITNSERELFACHKLWFFSSIEGLTANKHAAPLRQGGLVGRGIEAWALSGSTMTIEEIDASVLTPWLEGRVEYAREHDGSFLVMEESIAEDTALYAQSRAMLAGYVKRWAGDAEEWETIAVEAQVFRYLVHPLKPGKPLLDYPADPRGPVDTVTLIEGKPRKRRRRWGYGGKIDRLVRHRATAAVWLVETKTTKDTNLDAFCRKLHFDPQTRGYAWALSRPVIGHSDTALMVQLADGEEGFKIEGVMYDVLRKVTPEEPTVVKKGDRLVKASTISTDYDSYLAAILKHGFDPDDYRDQLDALKSQRFFQRELYPFSEREVEEFGVDAAWTAIEMIEEERRPVHTRQVRVCGGFNRGCPKGFESICMEDGPMARRSFQRMTIRHPELAGALAEAIPEHMRPATFGVGPRAPLLGTLESAAQGPPPTPPDPFGVAHDVDARTVDDGAAPAAKDDDTTEIKEDLFGPAADDDVGGDDETERLIAAIKRDEPHPWDDDDK